MAVKATTELEQGKGCGLGLYGGTPGKPASSPFADVPPGSFDPFHMGAMFDGEKLKKAELGYRIDLATAMWGYVSIPVDLDLVDLGLERHL
jgi:hypothetical protein